MNPLVSIIVPTYNNESTILRTLNSLVEQTLRDIEIIVVDDASTDATVGICDEAAGADSRISVISLTENQSALQTRRIGVERANGTYIMFCDSDDELVPQAAEKAAAFAGGAGYDIVHFSTSIVSATGSKHEAWEKALEPFSAELFGDDILLQSSFGQDGQPINGGIWNKLYSRSLVQKAWAAIDPLTRLYRAQDIYQVFLILAHATRYGGLQSQLYRYNFCARKSGNVDDRETFQHFLRSAHTYEALREYLGAEHWEAPEGFDEKQLLARLRDQFIGNQLNYWVQLPHPAPEALGDVLNTWDALDVVRVLAERFPEKARQVHVAFQMLDVSVLPRNSPSSGSVQGPRRIALLGNICGNGGVQKVMATQADLLVRAGHSVVIFSFDYEPDEISEQLPATVPLRKVGPRNEVGPSVTGLLNLLVEEQIDLLLNHDNYSLLFPWVPVATRAVGIKSGLFLHSFALLGLLDFRSTFAEFPTIAKGYDTTVTLSTADRMWWEASGVQNVRMLPNFGPPILQETPSPAPGEPEQSVTSGSSGEMQARLTDLLWVGRLQDDTKNLSGLLKAFARILKQRPETTLTLVGEEQNPGERARLEQLAEDLGIQEQLLFAGATQDVGSWYRSAKLFVSTSYIEGFNLTLVEAQCSGLPAIIYDLAYLETARGNPGIVTVPWGASARFATEVVALLEDAERRGALSAAGRDFAQKFSLDRYSELLLDIVQELSTGETPPALAAQNASLPQEDAVPVPKVVVDELYRLYQRMHERTTLQLRRAHHDSSVLRKKLSQLKRSIEETRDAQNQLEDAIAHIEKGKPVLSRRRSPQPTPSTTHKVGGMWPLWARQKDLVLNLPVSSPFADLSPDDPAFLPAIWALDTGLIASGEAESFNGSRRVSRIEFIRMLHRSAGSPPGHLEHQVFEDSEADDPAVFWALERGIMNIPETKGADVLPKWNAVHSMTRRIAARYLYRAAGQPEYRPPHTSPYSDLTAEHQFYKEMCWSAHQAVLPATRASNGTLIFQATHPVTYAEALAALFRQLVGPLAPRGAR
ncbi:glycosyltransferase [Nesterenkonia ebinurensis]|uniref:glycosyltransferase n=1 Tax=Nesterenkonia ebinurensis TaxID=2608252 RepID=UPI00168AC189|nr:glycosyltransferase [Nesterenkonia ebinurensis]